MEDQRVTKFGVLTTHILTKEATQEKENFKLQPEKRKRKKQKNIKKESD